MNKAKILWCAESAGLLQQYATLLAVAGAAGVTTFPDTATADQDFIETGVSQGWWDLLDWFGMFHYNNATVDEFATFNWITPSLYRMTESAAGGIAYGVKGYKNVLVDTPGEMVTNFNPSTDGVNYLQDSASRGCYIETAPTSGLAIDGNASGVINMMRYENSVIQRINQATTSLNAAVDLSGTGYTAINRSSDTAVQCYKGLTKSDRTATSSAINNAAQRIGRFGTGGSLNRSDVEIGCYYMGGSLTETMHNQIRAAILARRTAIGL